MNQQTSIYRRRHFPGEIIAQAVYLYHRFTLSLRDVEELLAMRGITVSYETIRVWCAHFGPTYARRLRNRRGRLGDIWLLDEVYIVTIQGKRRYLWRAIDQDGDTVDILVQKHKDKQAAKSFFRKLLRGERRIPNRIVTDKLRSYAAAKRETMPVVNHCQERYANNLCERSHEPTREQERQMRGFKSDGQAQRFLAVHARVQNTFRLGRHLLRAGNFRILRNRAFVEWQEVTAA